MRTVILFPHQMFIHDERVVSAEQIIFFEHPLFFTQYNFHVQKILLHRASMQWAAQTCRDRGQGVTYYDHTQATSCEEVFKEMSPYQSGDLGYFDVVDDYLQKDIQKGLDICGLSAHMYDNPIFLMNRKDIAEYFSPDRKQYRMADFYKLQRKKFNILIDHAGEPVGGQWSFDTENRKKYPRDITIPSSLSHFKNSYTAEALLYINTYFPHNPGARNHALYPVDRPSALDWCDDFIKNRLVLFGPYEDALHTEIPRGFHGVLTPMLNIGLITPQEVIDRVLKYAENNEVPLPSLEGFIRQIIGWREFMRGMYVTHGSQERTKNFWQHSKSLSEKFYSGSTRIMPVDHVIKKVLETGYAHHIERLMVLGNSMLLLEYNPDDVYQWFMELFIDSYDWVMVPNVYGMSQFADGGIFATKPYMSSSNYVRKMSNYPKGEWCDIWDGLFWQFIEKHEDFFGKNYRMSMMVRQYERMDQDKKNRLQKAVELYEKYLDSKK